MILRSYSRSTRTEYAISTITRTTITIPSRPCIGFSLVLFRFRLDLQNEAVFARHAYLLPLMQSQSAPHLLHLTVDPCPPLAILFFQHFSVCTDQFLAARH